MGVIFFGSRRLPCGPSTEAFMEVLWVKSACGRQNGCVSWVGSEADFPDPGAWGRRFFELPFSGGLFSKATKTKREVPNGGPLRQTDMGGVFFWATLQNGWSSLRFPFTTRTGVKWVFSPSVSLPKTKGYQLERTQDEVPIFRTPGVREN